MYNFLKLTGLSAVAAISAVLFCLNAQTSACTGFYVQADDGAVIYARSLEFAVPLDSKLIVIPRDTSFTGTTPEGSNGAKWKSRYGMVGMNFKGICSIVDGMNEKGLQFGLYYFPEFAKYKKYSPTEASKSIAVWELGTWLLSQFASVDEVRKHINEIEVVDTFCKEMGMIVPAHFILVDATGKSVVIEIVEGKMKLYENPVCAITNAPTFDWHLTNLRNYIKLSPQDAAGTQLRDFKIMTLGDGSGMLGLPGDITPPSRFIRAAYYSNALLELKTAADALKSAMRLHQTFYITKGVSRSKDPDGKPLIEFTEWQIYLDLKNLKLYYSTYDNLNIRMIDVAKLDFSPGPMHTMDINQPEKFQDLTNQLQPLMMDVNP